VDSTGIAEGFSGSPVYCRDSANVERVAGAISEGIGEYGNKTVLATPIEQMLGERVIPPRSARRHPGVLRAAHPLAVPLAISGLPHAALAEVQDGARRAHRTLLASPSGAGARFPPQDLVPGASVSVGYSSGDIVLGAVGTVTYRDGPAVYAFGHPFEGVGRRSLFLQDAYVYDVINNPSADATSYKLAAPGHNLGTTTGDGIAAITGVVGGLPPVVPVRAVGRDLDTGRLVSTSSSVADETDVGTPSGQLPLELVAPLSVFTSAYNVLRGAPAEQTGRLCVAVTIREARRPLHFCRRHVFTGRAGGGGGALGDAMASDLAQALSIVDTTTFAALHIEGVHAAARVERGARLAYMRSARALHAARAGHRARVRLRIRRLRGRASTLSFGLRVPSGLAPGRYQVRLVGTPDDDEGLSLSDIVFQVIGSTGLPDQPGGDPGPQSVGAVARKVRRLAGYDGITATFSGPGTHSRTLRAYTDRKLRVSGAATLTVRVAAPWRGRARRRHAPARPPAPRREPPRARPSRTSR
jgi:hypothetical protein